MESRLRAFLRLAIDLCTEEGMYKALAQVLEERYLFLPKVVVHGDSARLSVTSFAALTKYSLGRIISCAKLRGTLGIEYCQGLFNALEAELMRTFCLPASLSRQLTRFVKGS